MRTFLIVLGVYAVGAVATAFFDGWIGELGEDATDDDWKPVILWPFFWIFVVVVGALELARGAGVSMRKRRDIPSRPTPAKHQSQSNIGPQGEQ